jgi:hypothetical protein
MLSWARNSNISDAPFLVSVFVQWCNSGEDKAKIIINKGFTGHEELGDKFSFGAGYC